MIRSYGKIYNLGHKEITNLFKDPVEITEKCDGSQFSMGVFNGELKCRSHEKTIQLEQPPKMFQKAIETIKELEPLLNPNWTYRAEFLAKPKHNTICYDRVPQKNLIIFNIDKGMEDYLSYEEMQKEAERLGLECVPLLAYDKIDSIESFVKLLETVSCLGGSTIEGMVIKNYFRLGERDGRTLMGKYVNEKFKEQNKKNWKEQKASPIDRIGQEFRTEARWNKAIIHLEEQGKITYAPQDIPLLFKEVNKDVLEECGDEIKERLFKWGWKNISRTITKGLAIYYRKKLLEKQFETPKMKELNKEKTKKDVNCTKTKIGLKKGI